MGWICPNYLCPFFKHMSVRVTRHAVNCYRSWTNLTGNSQCFPVGSPNALCDMFYKEVVPGKAWGALVVTGICGLDYQALQGDWCISVSGFEVMRHTAREVTDMAVFQDVARLQTMVGGYHMRFFPQMRPTYRRKGLPKANK